MLDKSFEKRRGFLFFASFLSLNINNTKLVVFFLTIKCNNLPLTLSKQTT